jgi:hypothetical protein
MTGPHSETESPDTQQVSVAELLARNGTTGGRAASRRHSRRRGDSDAVTVAELTGEIPIIRDDHREQPEPGNGRVSVAARAPQPPQPPPVPQPPQPPPAPQLPQPPPAPVAEAAEAVARPANPPAVTPAADVGAGATYWSAPQPRWPRSSPQTRRAAGPERSEYPRPLRHTDASDADGPGSGAEHMSPDPVGHYSDISADVTDSEVREAERATEDSAYALSYLQASEGTLFGGQTFADELVRRRSDETAAEGAAQALAAATALHEDQRDLEGARGRETQAPRRSRGRMQALWRGIVTVLQSVLAVVFGAGLFIAFDQLWRWNPIVALVLSVLVILGLVVGVRVVRKTEDIASTLIAVAVGALITLGPLALLQSG